MNQLQNRFDIHDEQFLGMIHEIIESNDFQILRERKHHIHTSLSDHVLRVTYLCYMYNQQHPRSKVDLHELLRSALLHDYFFYDRYNKKEREFGRVRHVFSHPKIAAQNAINAYPDLTHNEIDAIKRHMFPLTIIPPTTRCGWLICWYDKVAAIEDYLDNDFVRLFTTRTTNK